MDPLTHGLTGALLGKGYFSERHGHTAAFAVTLGAVFPDVDVVAEFFSRDPLSVIKYHRGFTHSFVGLPLFAAALALLTRWWRRKDPQGPSWSILAVAYGVGIASHIFLDAMTSYGTQIWNPFSSDRTAWDLLFIIDFSLTAIVLLPQAAAWVYRRRENAASRAVGLWLLFTGLAAAVWALARATGFPFASWGVAGVSLILAALFFLPARREWGFRVRPSSWCRAGVYAMLGYIAACAVAHHEALARVKAFAAGNKVQVVRLAALPLPPTFLNWSAAILTPDGVFRSRFRLGSSQPAAYEFIADSPPDAFVAEALRLPDIQTYLWFARFPVIRTSREGDRHNVEFADLRFFGRRSQAPMPFTFRVVFDSDGRFLEEEWAENALGLHRKKQIAAAPVAAPK
jgi:membrane-bound metal-dependent hydrolase YbcI (DUF457 family)